MTFPSLNNIKMITEETTFAHHHCQQCGDPCSSDPHFCERHREPRVHQSTFKFASAAVFLGRKEPALAHDIILTKIDYEDKSSEVKVSMDLFPERKITLKKNQLCRDYPRMHIRLMDNTCTTLTVYPARLIIDDCTHDINQYSWKLRYSVRIEGERVEVTK